MEGVAVGEAEVGVRGEIGGGDDGGVFGGEPAFEGPVGGGFVAFVGVGDGEGHEGGEVGRVELQALFQCADGGGFLFVLGLRGAQVRPGGDVLRVLLDGGFEGEGGEGEVAAVAEDGEAFFEGVGVGGGERVVLLEGVVS